jgi:hypothetical protein
VRKKRLTETIRSRSVRSFRYKIKPVCSARLAHLPPCYIRCCYQAWQTRSLGIDKESTRGWETPFGLLGSLDLTGTSRGLPWTGHLEISLMPSRLQVRLEDRSVLGTQCFSGHCRISVHCLVGSYGPDGFPQTGPELDGWYLKLKWKTFPFGVRARIQSLIPKNSGTFGDLRARLAGRARPHEQSDIFNNVFRRNGGQMSARKEKAGVTVVQSTSVPPRSSRWWRFLPLCGSNPLEPNSCSAHGLPAFSLLGVHLPPASNSLCHPCFRR